MKHIRTLCLLYILTLQFSLSATSSVAQRITHTFRGTSLSEVLKYIDRSTKRYNISFMYNELEDFTVTASIQNQNVPEAIRQAIGFYPMRTTIEDSLITVECIQKEETKLTGRVIDEHGKPMEFVNIALLSPRDSSYINGGVSNANGDFVIPCSARNVITRLTFVGYKTTYHTGRLGNIGTVRMQPETMMLNGVVVKGQRPAYKMGKEGMITNVQGTSLAIAGTATEVLGLLPNVEGHDGSYKVFGKNGAPLIYINGKQVRNNNELTLIKSEEIKHVEVITNPGARYSAEVTSVIKITTMRKSGEGLSGLIEGQYRQAHSGSNWENAQLNYRKGGLDIATDVFLGNFKYWQKQTALIDIYHNVEEDTRAKLNTHQPNDLYASISANYDLGNENYAGLRYSLQGSEEDFKFGIDSKMTQESGKSSDWFYDTECNKPFGRTHSVNAYYMGHIGKVGIDFNADYMNRKGETRQKTAVTEDGQAAEQVQSDNMGRSRMYASKLTLTYPIGKGELSAGYEYTDTKRTSGFDSEGGVESHTNDEIKENTIAGFANYDVAFGRWLATAGLRYEHTSSDYYDHGTFVNEQSRNYANWFPNVGIGYGGNGFSLRMSYAMKTSRPSYERLSSFVQYSSRYVYEGGNPLLTPAKTHSFELQAVYKFLNLYAGYSIHRDQIIDNDDIYGENAVVLKSVNVPRRAELDLMLSASPKIGIWEPNYSIGLNKQFFDASVLGVNEDTDTPRWHFKLLNSFHMPWGVTLGVNWFYWGKGYYTTYLQHETQSLNLSLHKSFLKDRLSVRINANDVFKTNWDKGEYYGQYMKILRDNYSDSRNISVTVRYTFNSTQSKYKGTGAGNDEKNRL